MRKSNLIKVISILVVSLMVMLFSTNVMAAETDNGFTDLTPRVDNNTTNGTSNNTANSNSANNTNRNNTSNNTNRTNNTNNSSIYNNTNTLPKTGVTDSIPVAVLLIVFAISAVYAYKKIKDYRNI